MSRVIQIINVRNQSKMIPSQIHDDVQYRQDQNHCVIQQNTKDKAVVNKQRKVNVQTTNEYKQQILSMNSINIIMSL